MQKAYKNLPLTNKKREFNFMKKGFWEKYETLNKPGYKFLEDEEIQYPFKNSFKEEYGLAEHCIK